MQHALVHLVIIFLFFQCIQGTIRRFNSQRHSENANLYNVDSYFVEKLNGLPRTDKYKDVELPKLPRARRQDVDGDPEAYSFNLTGDDSQFAQVLYSGEGSQVIYLLTYQQPVGAFISSSVLYRSTDYGRTFLSQSNKLPPGYTLDYSVYLFNDKSVIFTDANNRRIYVTTNEGATFITRTIPVDPQTLKPHPTMPGWILGYDPYQRDLMYSDNFGASWGIVAQNIFSLAYSNQYLRQDYSWGEPGIDWDINNPSQSDISKVFYSVIDPNVASYSYNDRIIYVAYKTGSGYASRVLDPDLGYVYTYVLDGQFIYADKDISQDGNVGFELHVSYMRNPFNLTRIPTTFSHYTYFVASHRQSQSLIIVEHDYHFSLYLSEETGTYYTLSLEDITVDYYVVSTGEFAVDLEIIDSIDGTMIANQFAYVNGQWRNQTLITFDNGATWQQIPVPANADGSPSNCVLPTCSLHFHLYSSSEYFRIGVYSRDSAPGIIIAHGNPGSYLADTGSVYITRDGGLTWDQTLEFTWHVEIIDHGGLLVAAKDNHQDNSMTIRYSCDEGMTWSDFDFITSPIVVWGIITEPGETTTQVLLFGSESQITSTDWIITHVNFSSVFPRTCGTSDYYQWTVSDGRIGDQECLLGATRIIERRRPEVCCWNSRKYERVISSTPCQCTAADFECEWGYYRDINSRNCILGSNGPKLDCLTGYRKIPGNTCYGGLSSQYLPPDNCSLFGKTEENTGKNNGGDNHNSGNAAVTASVTVVVVLITLATVTFIIIGILLYLRKRNMKASSTAPVDPTVISNVQDPTISAKISDQEIIVGGTMDYETLIDEKSEL